MSATQIVATLQGHELVLQSELNEINNDIVLLQQMNNRYSVQCGISSFQLALSHLVNLRAEKERLLVQVTSQLRVMQDHVASSTALVSQLSLGGVPVSNSVVLATPIVAPRVGGASSIVAVGDTPYVLPAGGPGVVHVHTPSGLVVTTNSSILANSPQRRN